MITFHLEDWQTFITEARVLFPRHYDETGDGKAHNWPINVDEGFYASVYSRGALQIVSARCAGKLVGYHVAHVGTNPHYKQLLVSRSDLFWLAPEHRGGLIGMKLFKFVEQALRQRNVAVAYEGTKLSPDLSPLFERLEYQRIEFRYRKILS